MSGSVRFRKVKWNKIDKKLKFPNSGKVEN